MILDYLRLAFATAVVLAPGRLAARSLGLRGRSASLACSFGALFLAWAVVFTVHGDVWLAAGVLAAVAVAALLVGARGARRPRVEVLGLPRPVRRGRRVVWLGGVVLGLALWHVAGVVSGDGLFHLARVRKLVDLGDLHLRTVDEFVDGGLHPGYAFPLWHGFLALVSVLSGLDPSVVVNHEASLLVPLALVVVWESGVAVFASGGAGVAVVAATLGLYCFAAGHGGSYTSLALPATAARQILVPASVALFFTYLGSGRRVELVALVAAFGGLALVHPTYALFALIPLGAYALASPADLRRSVEALAAACAPVLLTYLWLRPIVAQTISVNPTPATEASSLAHYGGQLVVSSLSSYRLAAGVLGRAGPVAVAALALVPLAGFAGRRRWASLVLAGSTAVLALMLVPVLFTHFSDLVSLSQSRRAAGFLPFAVAFTGGLLLLVRGALALPAALAAGVALELLWPGDFGTGVHGGPAPLTWFALAGGALALVVAKRAPRSPRERPGLAALAAALFVLPIAVHGFAAWSPLTPRDPNALSPALREQLARVPARSVVIAGPAMSYEILADFPLYVVAAPLAHVANTHANDPVARLRAVARWLATGDPAIPRRYGATWAVEGGRRLVHLAP